MAKQLSSYFVSLVRDACLKAFWRKRTLAFFLKQNHISDSAVAPLFQGMTKAEVLSNIFDKLSINQNSKTQSVILGIAKELSEMDTFPDLSGLDDSNLKINTAKHSVDILRKALVKLEAMYY